MNTNIVTQVTRKWRFTCDQCIIEMKDINEKCQTFIFVFLVLIDSVLSFRKHGTQMKLMEIDIGPKC
jgi:hypothetical protein